MSFGLLGPLSSLKKKLPEQQSQHAPYIAKEYKITGQPLGRGPATKLNYGEGAEIKGRRQDLESPCGKGSFQGNLE